MTTETNAPVVKRREKRVYRTAASAPVYGMGFLGALVYYLGHAGTVWIGLLGFLKALFWPGFLVYELLKYLGM